MVLLLLLSMVGRMKGTRGVVGVGVIVCVLMIVVVVGWVVVIVSVMVVVTWMKEVSSMETVSVKLCQRVTSSVMKTVTPALVVIVMNLGPLGTRGARVMGGMVRSAMVGGLSE